MADALCGPSNPLKTFQNHASVDRSLQQDRIAARLQSVQGFRSSTRETAGALDAEFEAFLSGQPLEGAHGTFTPHKAANPFATQHLQSRSPDWASDFQNLHISNDQIKPLPQSQFRSQAPLQRTFDGSWHQEFSRQNSQPLPLQHGQTQSLSHHRYINPHTNQYVQPHAPFSSGVQKSQIRDEEFPFDTEALERAFDAADQELQQSERQIQNGMNQDTLESVITERHLLENEGPVFAQPIGSDKIASEAHIEHQEQLERSDEDELARTAGELLSNVQHDQSQKFKSSNFLSLMRQLRDREVRVEGDKIVDTAQPLHPGGDFYPDGKFTPDQHNLVSPELDQHGDHENNFTFDSEGNILNDLVFDSFRINQDFVDSIVAGNRHVGFDNLMPEHIEIQKPSRSSGELEHGQMDVTMSGAINHNGSQI